MGRMPRINIENALYYVISRGDHNQNIFTDDADYSAYIDLLKKSKIDQGFKLYAFCLIPGEIRLLLELKGAAAISDIMHSLNSTYTKYFNSRHGKKGHLFQERYELVLAEKEEYLPIASASVHMNPSTSGVAADYKVYQYSSYASYAGEVGKIDISKEISETKSYLKGLGYSDFISGLNKSDVESFNKELDAKQVIGNDLFLDKISLAVENQKAQAKTALGGKGVNKKFIIISGSMVILLGIFSLYLFGKAVATRSRLKMEMSRRDTEIAKRLGEAKVEIAKDIDEKYRADMVSYGAMSKRLEYEKKRVTELEKQIKPEVKGAAKN
jgi:REP element-mobilizing transposase RayT